MKSRYHIYIVLLIIALISAFFFLQDRLFQKANAQCSKDSDCIAAECCHAAQCSPVKSAPNCSDIMCTQECLSNTLDCGQASCACNQGTCFVRSSK